MSVMNWNVADTARAREFWVDYQREHDLSERQGQTVGIDPVTGAVWFGDSIADVVSQRDSAGLDTPLFFERVGARTYWRKGGRR